MVYLATSLLLVLIPMCVFRALTGAAVGYQDEGTTNLETLTHFDLESLPLDNKTYTLPKNAQRNTDLQCRSLKTKMQISNGFCTSIKPVSSVLCMGDCLPKHDVPWYAQAWRFWSPSKAVEYRCEDDVIKRKRVELVCKNGETLKISLKVVRNCKCTRYRREQNRPSNWMPWNANGDQLDNSNQGSSNRNHRRRQKYKNDGKKTRRKDRKRRKGRKKKETAPTRNPSEL